ncbi:hypothetical protein OPU71_20860 [Niveibacterium sp. 24ML]|uniref:hypothetical protein n=1 Tax=Niveibacterium sp. 24ML TaxID=2985512 RepID=UPI002271AA4A|nr:hypothetical protein [Niveibacterium sp. 24ML]MCX9158571.1 hypothetical protein [Niveibacterium sp. 24ML]
MIQRLLPQITVAVFLVSFVEASTFHDASNTNEAVAMLTFAQAEAETLHQGCTSIFPADSAALSSNYEKWKQDEFAVIEKSKVLATIAISKNPDIQQYIDRVKENATARLKVASTTNDARLAVQKYCISYFNNLATGVWRTRTPDVYKFVTDAKLPE